MIKKDDLKVFNCRTYQEFHQLTAKNILNDVAETDGMLRMYGELQLKEFKEFVKLIYADKDEERKKIADFILLHG